MKLKICGMKYLENIEQIATLQPSYLGFIFYEKSPRNFEGLIPHIPKTIKKTGVFVNEHLEIVISLAQEYQLEALQLHGEESVNYITELTKQLPNIEIIKVFGIKNEFNFTILKPYLTVVNYFLFDTKGKNRGGNGISFNWEVLKNYPYSKPFFLSGGIGLEEITAIKKIIKTNLPIYALDVNSKFEIKPGLKSIEKLQAFKNLLTQKEHSN